MLDDLFSEAKAAREYLEKLEQVVPPDTISAFMLGGFEISRSIGIKELSGVLYDDRTMKTDGGRMMPLAKALDILASLEDQMVRDHSAGPTGAALEQVLTNYSQVADSVVALIGSLEYVWKYGWAAAKLAWQFGGEEASYLRGEAAQGFAHLWNDRASIADAVKADIGKFLGEDEKAIAFLFAHAGWKQIVGALTAGIVAMSAAKMKEQLQAVYVTREKSIAEIRKSAWPQSTATRHWRVKRSRL